MAELTQRTVIGPDTHIKGEMSFDSTAQILGSFEGRISSKGEIQIGEGAVCKAAVEAATVTVDGLVEGDITARERVSLNASARVCGDVLAKTLVVAEGASFSGQCRVGADALEAAQAAAEQPAGARPSIETKRPRPGTDSAAGLHAKLAGLEAKLAGIGKGRSADLETAANGG